MYIPIPVNNKPCLDLFRQIKLLKETVSTTNDAPAFTYNKNRHITFKLVTSRLKTILGKAGLNPDLFSSHSFCRCGASVLSSVGATELMVQVLDEWSSLVYTCYLFMDEQDRLDAQLLMAKAIIEMQ